MTGLFRRAAIGVSMILVSSIPGWTYTFDDGFEYASQSKFLDAWSVRQWGAMELSGDVNHTANGKWSVKATPGRPQLVGMNFGRRSQPGRVDIWMFVTYEPNNTAALDSHGVIVSDPDEPDRIVRIASLGNLNRDFFGYEDDVGKTGWKVSNKVRRVTGWHKLSFVFDGKGVELLIDDVSIYKTEAGWESGFRQVALANAWATGTDSKPGYFDDLKVTLAGEPDSRPDKSKWIVSKFLLQGFLRVFFEPGWREIPTRVELSIVDPASSVAIKTTTVSEIPPGRIVRDVRIDDLPIGQYGLVAKALDQQGKTITEQSCRFDKPSKPPWLNNSLGVTDKLLPPWTPLQVAADHGSPITTHHIKCWGREYLFANSLFPVQINNQGKRVLSSPMTLTGIVEGKRTDFSLAKFRITESKDAKVSFVASSLSGPLSVEIKGYVEFDGFMWFQLSLRGQRAAQLDHLVLRIPVKSEFAGYYHYHGSSGVRSGRVGPAPWTVETWFCPLVYLASENLGLTWCAESDEYWQNVDRSKAIQIRNDGREVVLSLTLVDKPVTVRKPVEFSFGVMASPVKPLPRVHPLHRVVNVATTYGPRDLDLMSRYGIRQIFYHDSWSDPYGSTQATDEQGFQRIISGVHKRGIKVGVYYSPSVLAVKLPIARDYADELVCFEGERESIEKMVDRTYPYFHDACHGSKAWRDAFLWGIQELLRKYNVNGLFLDNAPPNSCASLEHGCGFMKEGVRHATFPIRANREFFKRMYAYTRSVKKDFLLLSHISSAPTLPHESFVDTYVDGEQFEPSSYYQPGFEEAFRAEFLSHPWGVPATMWVTRFDEDIAWSLVHGIGIIGSDGCYLPVLARMSEVWDIFDYFQVSRARFLPYWQQPSLAKSSGPNVKVSAYQRGGRALYIVACLGAIKKEIAPDVAFDLKAAGLMTGTPMKDLLTKEHFPDASHVRLRFTSEERVRFLLAAPQSVLQSEPIKNRHFDYIPSFEEPSWNDVSEIVRQEVGLLKDSHRDWTFTVKRDMTGKRLLLKAKIRGDLKGRTELGGWVEAMRILINGVELRDTDGNGKARLRERGRRLTLLDLRSGNYYSSKGNWLVPTCATFMPDPQPNWYYEVDGKNPFVYLWDVTDLVHPGENNLKLEAKWDLAVGRLTLDVVNER